MMAHFLLGGEEGLGPLPHYYNADSNGNVVGMYKGYSVIIRYKEIDRGEGKFDDQYKYSVSNGDIIWAPTNLTFDNRNKAIEEAEKHIRELKDYYMEE